MRRIEYTSRFKKDYRREKSGRHARILDEKLKAVLDLYRKPDEDTLQLVRLGSHSELGL